MFKAAFVHVGLAVMNSVSYTSCKARVDLGAVLGLVDHAAHLIADDVAGDANAAGAADIERMREGGVVAGVQLEPVYQLQLGLVGLLDALDVLDLRQARQQLRSHVDGRAAGNVVEQDRLVGGLGDLFVVAHDPAWARLVVVGGDAQGRVHAMFACDLGQVHGVFGVVGAGATDDRGAGRALA